MTDNTGGNQGDKASANIIRIINAAADAKTAQTTLQKELMLKQIGDKMDLKQNAAKLQQGNQSEINMKNMNMNWLEQQGQDISTPTGSTPAGVGGNGVATGQTPTIIGNDAGAQTPSSAPPMSTMPVPQPQQEPAQPTTSPTAQPQQGQPSPQMSMVRPATSPIGKPLPPPQGNIMMSPTGPVQNPNANTPDNKTYTQMYSKWKSGQPLSQGEQQWIQKKFNLDQNGQPISNSGTPTVTPPIQPSEGTSRVQQGLRNIEKVQGLPEGSMWMNPATGNPEVSPIWQKKVEALNTAQANYLVMQPQRDQQTAEVFNKALDPSYYRAGAFGDSKKVFDRGEALQSLFNAGSAQPGGLDKRQIEELTIGYQNMLSRGGNSVTQVDALLPKSVVGNVNALTEWLTNNPKGTDQMNFVDRVHTGVEREMATTQAQMDRTRLQRIATFDPWIQRNPEQARNMMMSYGINPDDYQKYKDNGFKQETAVQGGSDKNGTGAPTGMQSFTVGGVTYNIPSDKVDAFKQKAGIQ